MFASLLRRPRKRRASQHSPFSSPLLDRHGDPNHGQQASDDEPGSQEDYAIEDEDDDDDEPLLPIFSSEHLDKLPIYDTTHAIRMLITQRCETTLTWDQLRSPQVSQFLVKPIQQQVRSSHFSRGTIYALVANCLQFQKEAQTMPSNMGVNKTRAVLCELLAVRLLKEYSTRELIDALFYDFDPLQGLSAAVIGASAGILRGRNATNTRPARISTVEIAIRAQAKKFLAHPSIVQQLEAVWAGSIVFHSAADHLHRKPTKTRSTQQSGYGTIPAEGRTDDPSKDRPSGLHATQEGSEHSRRSVTLYDPHDASLFKLSRLRVPRYRQLFSTCSLAIMLGLFLAVLVEKSLDITALEVVFWFWSAGFMLDEVIGFSEQGFGLYIMSFWNVFDLGILMLFLLYYVLRLYGIIMPDASKHHMARMAYDVLASTAVLLFPRLFSVLDHYRYFSQLLIAFRMMALDLVAILVLILISCSGFFVAFTLSFNDTIPDAASAAYALFQMLMGFTPAAWDRWNDLNPLGKTVLVMFLVITHFLVVTILITVLTNSFMAIVQNANEEHQFLFAVNTISMVKSDALFSYVAPTNIIGWLLTPLRHLMPFRQYVKLNRVIIKATHFPMLFAIFVYERIVLSSRAEEPTDLVEQRGRTPTRVPAFSVRGVDDMFNTGRMREASLATFRQDRALEEVFRRPYKDDLNESRRIPVVSQRRQSSNVVRDWMNNVGDEGGASPPLEEHRSVLDRLETRRPRMPRRAYTTDRVSALTKTNTPNSMLIKSITSDPDQSRLDTLEESILELDEPQLSPDEEQHQTDADGDDELLSQEDDEDNDNSDSEVKRRDEPAARADSDDETADFSTPLVSRRQEAGFPSSIESARRIIGTKPMASAGPRDRPRGHQRNVSTNTILYSPVQPPLDSPSPSRSRSISPSKRPSRPGTRAGLGTRTPKRPANLNLPGPSLPRPMLPQRDALRTTPNIASILSFNPRERAPSINARALDLASDIGDNRHVPYIPPGGFPASFGTQMDFANRQPQEDKKMVDRIMLARMGQLEESFRDVVKEVKEWRIKDSRANSKVPSKATSKAASWKSSLPGDSLGGSTGTALKKKSKKTQGKAKAGSPKKRTIAGITPDDFVLEPEGMEVDGGVETRMTDAIELPNEETGKENLDYQYGGKRSSI